MAMETVSRLQNLIGSIYDAALAPDGWTSVLEQFVQVMDLSGVAVIYQDSSAGLQGILLAEGISQDFIDLYGQHYFEQDYARHVSLHWPVGTWVNTVEIFPDRKHRKTEFYNDFLKPAGLGEIAGTVLSNSDVFAALGMHRTSSQRAFDPADERLYRILEPHFARALAIQRRLALSETRVDSFAEIVDRLALGVVFLSAAGQILYANSAARSLAAQDDGFALECGGILAARPRQTSLVRSLIAEAVRTSKGLGLCPGSGLHLERPSGRRPFEVLIAPLAKDRVQVGSSFAMAVLFIRDPEDQVTPAEM